MAKKTTSASVWTHLSEFWKKYSERIRKVTLLVLSFISIALFFRLFNTPFLYSELSEYRILPLDVFDYGTDQLVDFAVFIPLVICSFVILFRVILIFRRLSSPAASYISTVQTLLFFCTVINGLYFLAGMGISTFYNAQGRSYSANPSFTVLIWQVVLVLIFALLSRGVVDAENQKKKDTAKWARLELFLYSFLAAGLSIGSIFSDILQVEFISPEHYDALKLNGFKVLTGYMDLDKGFQIVAYILMVLLVMVVSLAFLTLISFIGKSKLFYKFALASLMTSGFSTLLIGLTGKYYEVVTQLNANTLFSWISQNLYAGSEIDLRYKVKSSALLWFFGVLLMVALVLIRKPYTKGTMGEAEISVQAMVGNGLKTQASENTGTEAVMTSEKVFDPCPAFSELDLRAQALKNETAELLKCAYEEPTLPGLVKYIVSYARNSRLRLSYSEKDIAAFIAGLGTTRLTILQGMSGTGKTSLPKIFCEAIYGTCDIVEVESSWRDKHELLGYYNEFSRIYTPKKFTQALYQAALDQERITVIVLDELNLSRIEYYFSDFLSLMENEEENRKIKLVNCVLCKTTDEGLAIGYSALEQGHTLKIPQNVWFVGTANRDESTFEISDKVYDRAHTMNFNKRAPRIYSSEQPLAGRYLSKEAFLKLVDQAKEQVSFSLEGCDVIRRVEELLIPYNISFGNRVANQIESFVKIYACCFEPSEEIISEAVETILLSKVVSKLEYKNVENKELLAEEFEKLNLRRCSEFVKKLNED